MNGWAVCLRTKTCTVHSRALHDSCGRDTASQSAREPRGDRSLGNVRLPTVRQVRQDSTNGPARVDRERCRERFAYLPFWSAAAA
eukprot:5637559-Prymnesium_polylepis.1